MEKEDFSWFQTKIISSNDDFLWFFFQFSNHQCFFFLLRKPRSFIWNQLESLLNVRRALFVRIYIYIHIQIHKRKATQPYVQIRILFYQISQFSISHLSYLLTHIQHSRTVHHVFVDCVRILHNILCVEIGSFSAP